MDWHCPHLDHPAQLVHLINALRAGEPEAHLYIYVSCSHA